MYLFLFETACLQVLLFLQKIEWTKLALYSLVKSLKLLCAENHERFFSPKKVE